ncbi:TetR family transcriptional regulator [Arthrobacter sp. ERGS1:01]|uniref:ScbR family autoregulator-binding transcription factor n=1 Tax=Arthrobacter sp. ERGS1:01 TaxID=1704044 RepID=UPI0006B4125E|nr:ScbR family autoregulator-binding transcription factor [Arthrobacter sp. ERGS1:01]ALE05781.1 TetR family transcriptional regulator [Arthrobacter sp. ERGS1:01]
MQQRAKATRTAILEGAALVFDEKGYGNASLGDVTERASATKGALYFHFKSKEELALAVIDEQHLRVRTKAEALAGTGLPALELIIGMCRLFGHQLLDDAVVRAGIRLTFESSAFDGDVKGPYADWIDTMEMLLRQAQVEKDVAADINPASFARYLVASFSGVQMVSNVLTSREDVLQRIEEMWDFMMRTLKP